MKLNRTEKVTFILAYLLALLFFLPTADLEMMTKIIVVVVHAIVALIWASDHIAFKVYRLKERSIKKEISKLESGYKMQDEKKSADTKNTERSLFLLWRKLSYLYEKNSHLDFLVIRDLQYQASKNCLAWNRRSYSEN